MLDKFSAHFKSHFPELVDQPLLLAISGGIDSVVLLHLLLSMGSKPALAHAHFGLRGVDSDLDADFVGRLAKQHQLKIYCERWDTKKYMKEHHLSLQEAARELRYNWFHLLVAQENYRAVLTAHHADDCLETFLMHIARGAGLDGLVGIPAVNGPIARPLLPFSRQEIEDYAVTHQLIWREDASNVDQKYRRNHLRLAVIPAIKAVYPDFISSFLKTQTHLQQAQRMNEEAAQEAAATIISKKNEQLYIAIQPLLALNNYSAYLYAWLKQYGFTAWQDIQQLPFAQSGKVVMGKNWLITKNRAHLVVSKIAAIDEQLYSVKQGKNTNIPFPLVIEAVSEMENPSNGCIFVDADLLTFPLILRKWRHGDVFYPLGMHQKKLVSKYFKDEKLSLPEKQDTWLLCTAAEIIWIIGKRQDNRYKITSSTQHIFKISIA